MIKTDVSVEFSEYVATVRMHRPPANFFDLDTITELADIYESLDSDPNCRAIVLCSEGKHFCAGADFSNSASAIDFGDVRQLYAQAIRIFEARTPVVAAVQGAAIGGGLGLALSADFRIAAASSRFSANFTQLGFHPGFGITATLPEVVGHQQALDLVLTGRRIGGEDAYRMGLCDVLVAESEIESTAVDTARLIGTSAPLAVASARETLRYELVGRVHVAIARELEEQAILRESSDFEEGITAAVQRRKPIFVGR